MNGFLWLALLLLVFALIAVGVAYVASFDAEGRGARIATWALIGAVCLALCVAAALGAGIYRAVHPPTSDSVSHASNAASSPAENVTPEK